MAKKIFYTSEAREKVLAGAKQLYDAVKVTFGILYEVHLGQHV